jgi:hypothetical protein
LENHWIWLSPKFFLIKIRFSVYIYIYYVESSYHFFFGTSSHKLVMIFYFFWGQNINFNLIIFFNNIDKMPTIVVLYV